jgi:hypothetical protein
MQSIKIHKKSNNALHLTTISLALQCVKKNCESSLCCTKDEGRVPRNRRKGTKGQV